MEIYNYNGTLDVDGIITITNRFLSKGLRKNCLSGDSLTELPNFKVNILTIS